MNLQQLPNRPEYLACIIAPQGMKVVGADFSKQELNLIAEGSKEPVWIDALNNNEDLHGKVASMVFEIPIEDVKKKFDKLTVGGVIVYLRDKTPRDIAKTINFMLAYGGSEFKLADTLGISVDSAKAIIKSYFAAVPKVKDFLQSCANYGVKNKCMRSFKPYSIVRHFAGYDMSDMKQRGEVERMSKNTIIQATAAIMTKLALVSLRRVAKSVEYKVEIFLQVHDAIYCYVQEGYENDWAALQKAEMQKAGEVFVKSVPANSDVLISDRWEK